MVIGLFGDDPNDFMAKCGAKWLHKNGVNALCISPGKKNYSHVNNPLERIETAIRWLKNNGNRKIGIMGMSTAGMDSLVAASLYADTGNCTDSIKKSIQESVLLLRSMVN